MRRTLAIISASIWASTTLYAAEPVSPSNAYPTVQDLDEAVEMMKESVWLLPSILGEPPPDDAGNSIEKDIEQYLLTESVMREVAQIRARAVQQLDEDGSVPPEVLASFSRLVSQHGCILGVIAAHWSPGGNLPYHSQLIEAMLRQLPEDPAIASDLRALRARATYTREQLPGELQACADPQISVHTQRMDALRADYDAMRGRLASMVDAAIAEGRIPPRTLDRETPCPAPKEASAGADRRARMKTAPEVGQFYPPNDRMNLVEGTVRVRLEWDANGCVMRSSVVGSSGSEAMDAAALRVSLGVEMEPAISGGVAQAEGAVLPIRFALRPAGTP